MGRNKLNIKNLIILELQFVTLIAKQCKYLNARTDDKGYPYGYECLKYEDSVFEDEFTNSKIFKTHRLKLLRNY